MVYVVIAIGLLATFNFLRIFISLTVANLSKAYKIKKRAKSRTASSLKQYGISVVIPAYNEEKDIAKCVESVYQNDFLKKEVIVIDDGSTDNTAYLLEKLKKKYPSLIIVHQKNSGKATALNTGIIGYATFPLVMVLDGDSFLAKSAIKNMVRHFEDDDRLVAMATNVRISDARNIVEYAQQVEYQIGNKYKEAEPTFNLEYIIGGIGSTFRREALLLVKGYDLDSVTEDIALSMKIIKAFGNKVAHISYADDVICYTPPAHNFKDLKKQRFRWKYGRFKALVKYKDLFFSTNFKKYSFVLTWWKLPKIIFFEEFMMLIDPLMLIFMGYLLVSYLDVKTLLGVVATFFLVAVIARLSDQQYSLKKSIKVVIIAPLTIFLLYIINFADYYSLIKSVFKYKDILTNSNPSSKWNHIQR